MYSAASLALWKNTTRGVILTAKRKATTTKTKIKHCKAQMVCMILGIYRICTTMVPEKNSDSFQTSRWRHQIERFSALLALCAGNSPVTGDKGQWRGALMFFYLRPIKRLSKQSWRWWFETPSCSLWRHCNVSHNSNLFPNKSLYKSYGHGFIL